MKNILNDERGSAMVMALVFITGLALTASVIVYIATSEKRVTFNQYSHSRSFYASDAGTETTLNWLYINSRPPRFQNEVSGLVTQDNNFIEMEPDHKFKVDLHARQGANGSFQSYSMGDEAGSGNDPIPIKYVILSSGASANDSETLIEVLATRKYMGTGSH